jgi:NADH-quinone oxidoreductase subunit C
MSDTPTHAPLPPMEDLGRYIAGTMSGVVIGHSVTHNELTLTASAAEIVALITFLKTDARCRFTTLIDIAGVDYPHRAKRFNLVYHLLSMQKNQRVRVKLSTDEATPVPSIIGVFPVADWYEREAFDMYGILFSDHPDLRRLLTDYGFQGFPLRKEFPLTGFVEVRYDPEQARVVYEPVKLTQSYRNFDFLSPWEGMLQDLPGDEKASKG